MEKIKKGFNLIIIIIFLCQNISFGMPERDSALRLPSLFSFSGVKDIYNNQWVTVEGLDGILLNKETGRIKFRYEDKPPMIIDFVLWGVRHGQTEGNRIQGFFQGSGDGEMNQLTKDSERQAATMAEKFFAQLKSRLKPGEKLVVVVSNLNRAIKTADPFIKLAGENEILERVPGELDKLAQEMSFGIYDSKAPEELRKELSPEQFELYQSYERSYRRGLNAAIVPENGENFLHMLIRTKQLLEELNRLYKGRTVIIYGHGSALSAVRVLLGDKGLVDESGQIDWRAKMIPHTTPLLLFPMEEQSSPNRNLASNTALPEWINEIPEVKDIKLALSSENKVPIIVVGGGGSGKTEKLVAALDSLAKKSSTFNLRDWTITRLCDPAIRQEIVSDPQLDELGKNYLSALQSDIETGNYAPDQIKKRIKDDYLKDKTLGIKYVEAYLVAKQLQRIEMGLDFNDGYIGGDNALQAVFSNKEAGVVIFDEFDLGIKRDISDIEIETAESLMRIATKLPGKQIVTIIHPAGRRSAKLMEKVTLHLSSVSGQNKVEEIEMQYLPRELESRALNMIGISGKIAEELMDYFKGLPTAYLDLIFDANYRKGLQDLFSATKAQKGEEAAIREVANKLVADTERKIDKNTKIVVGLSTDNAQKQIDRLAKGQPISVFDKDTIDDMRRTLYVDVRGTDVNMSPVVAKVLLQKAIEQADTIALTVDLGDDLIEGIKRVENVVLQQRDDDVPVYGSKYHLTLIPTPDSKVLTENAGLIANALINLRGLGSARVIGIGKRVSAKDGSSAYYIAIDSPELNKFLELIPMLPNYGLHVTLGFTKEDVHEDFPKDTNPELTARLTNSGVKIPNIIYFRGLTIRQKTPTVSDIARTLASVSL